MNNRDIRDQEIIRDLLVHIDSHDGINQRDLARELGIALGLTNAYIKRCVKKGLLKITQAPARRYRYYLTPQGFAEKSRLVAQYFSDSLTFFRRARNQLCEILETCEQRGWKRIALYGHSELCEIALLCANSRAITLVAIVDPSFTRETAFGLDVVPTLNSLDAIDALIITDFTDPQASFDQLSTRMPTGRLFAPGILSITQNRENGVSHESDSA